MDAAAHLETRKWQLAAGQIIGDRASQQDAFGMIELGDDVAFVLADGMGGHTGGELAARLAVEAGLAAFSKVKGDVPDRLLAARDAANLAIADEKASRPRAFAEMGCTLIAAHLSKQGAQFVSVGDSLALLQIGEKLFRLNDDHSMVPVLAQMVRDGELDETDAATDSRRNQLRAALTGEHIALTDLRREPVEIPAIGSLIVASDGLLALSPGEIAETVKAADTPQTACAGLLERARAVQSRDLDNTSVIVCQPTGKRRNLFRS